MKIPKDLKIRLQEDKKGKLKVYIHSKNQKRGNYMYRPDTPLDVYYKYWSDKQKKQTKGKMNDYITAYTMTEKLKGLKISPKLKRQAQQYAKKTIKYPSFSNIEKGMTKLKLEDIHHISDNDTRNAYKKLLSPLVMDKELLELITLENNIQKIKHRFEHKLDIIGETKGRRGTLIIIGKKSLQEIIEDMKKEFKIKQKIDFSSGGTLNANKRKYAQMGYSITNISDRETDTLKKIDCEIIFRAL